MQCKSIGFNSDLTTLCSLAACLDGDSACETGQVIPRDFKTIGGCPFVTWDAVLWNLRNAVVGSKLAATVPSKCASGHAKPIMCTVLCHIEQYVIGSHRLVRTYVEAAKISIDLSLPHAMKWEGLVGSLWAAKQWELAGELQKSHDVTRISPQNPGHYCAH